MDTLRKPLFIVAVAFMVLALLVELGSSLVMGLRQPGAARAIDAPPPGFGISYLTLLDGLVLYIVLLMGAALVIPERVLARVHGIVTFILSLLALLGAIVMFFVGLTLLMLMIALLLAPIFGTIAYFAIYGDFDREGAGVILSLTMLLKLCFAGCLVFAHQRFLQNKGLILIVLTSLLGTLLTGFLHGFVPLFLVSITDTIAALINVVLGGIWALFFLIGAIIAIIKAIV